MPNKRNFVGNLAHIIKIEAPLVGSNAQKSRKAKALNMRAKQMRQAAAGGPLTHGTQGGALQLLNNQALRTNQGGKKRKY